MKITMTYGSKNHRSKEVDLPNLSWHLADTDPWTIISNPEYAHGRKYKIVSNAETDLHELYRGSEYSAVWTHVESFRSKSAAVMVANLIANG